MVKNRVSDAPADAGFHLESQGDKEADDNALGRYEEKRRGHKQAYAFGAARFYVVLNRVTQEQGIKHVHHRYGEH